MAREVAAQGLLEHFQSMEDPRVEGRTEHRLLDILSIAICAVLSNADGWEEMEEYAREKEPWLRTWLELPNGIPSHDTIRRVFILVDPKAFAACFDSWVQAVASVGDNRFVSVDGKTVRGSYDRGQGKAPIHMVSAWAQENSLILGQLKTEAKSNEITAIPELLDTIDLRDTVVTIDAMGCQKGIAERIVDRGGEYVLALKGNQEGLREEAEALFREIEGQTFDDVNRESHRTKDEAHGRIEDREYTIAEALRPGVQQRQWKRMRCFGRVRSQRTVDGERTEETRYYITSLPCDAKLFAQSVRGHWSIENRLHWMLDVGFREDESRVRSGHAPENLALLRRLALLLLKRETTSKRGIAAKRKRAAWSNSYLLTVLRTV